MIGTVVGSYRVTGTIGGGGMGMIYRAEHTLIGRKAAVKVLLPDFARNREIVNRFFNEAKAATAIQHPGIVEIFDFGYLPDSSAYIVMEFLPGESLASRITSRGRLTEQEAMLITRGIVGALGAAHAKGIVHRDIKPDNVFLVPDPEMPTGERVKLLDFGIAKLTDEGAGNWSQTRTGAVMGTPTYMAPEQCRGAGNVDHRADLYAVGCILFEMLAGRPPFVGDGAGEIIGAHQFVPAPPLRAFVPEATDLADHLVTRLLAKAPHDRFESANDVLRLLGSRSIGATGSQPYVHAMPSSPHTPTTLGGAASELRTSSGGRRGLVIGSSLAVVAAIGIVAIVLASGGSNNTGSTNASGSATQPAPPPPAPPPPPAAAAAIVPIDAAVAAEPPATPPAPPPAPPSEPTTTASAEPPPKPVTKPASRPTHKPKPKPDPTKPKPEPTTGPVEDL